MHNSSTVSKFDSDPSNSCQDIAIELTVNFTEVQEQKLVVHQSQQDISSGKHECLQKHLSQPSK